jgi:hypothetical protein
MIRRGAPSIIEQFDITEFLEYQAAPVRWRARYLESTLASSAVLIAEHPQLPVSVPAQSVRAQKSPVPIIAGLDWPLVRNGSPDKSIDVLDRLDFRDDDAHLL